MASWPVLSLTVMLRISASRTWTLRDSICCFERGLRARPGTSTGGALDQFLGGVLGASFWQAAFIAGLDDVLLDLSTLPMLATIFGASAGVRPQTTVKSASTW